MIEQFKKDVDQGLSAENKNLSSKYFYDKKGDALFVEIMNLPEYYLTRAEFEIFSIQNEDLIDAFDLKNAKDFEIVELGAGDGTKTIQLLNKLVESYEFQYIPIDISLNALGKLEQRLQHEIPSLNVRTMQGEYFDILDELNQSDIKKVILFLGSNIGNLDDVAAARFLRMLSFRMNPGDKLLIGVDLIKSKDIVIPAYSDAQGITAEFNLNLLRRINNELGGDFNLDEFQHYAYYTEEEGIAKSYLESRKDQEVHISALNKTYQFKKGERIHMEISRKYNDEILQDLILDSKLSLQKKFTDAKGYFADYLLQLKTKK